MKRYLFLLFFLFLSFDPIQADQIKLYTFYSPTHSILYEHYFLPSIQDDFDLQINQVEQECPSGSYMTDGWIKTTKRKVDMIIDAVQDNWDKVFIYSDVDVQFFRPSQEIILQLIADKDLVIQRDNPSGVACTGFFACKGNSKTLQFWKNVKQTMSEIGMVSDQGAFNQVIEKGNHGIVWDFLPSEFLSGGTLTGYHWNPGQSLIIPEGIILHHANWTVGVNSKIAQLQYVKQVVESRKRL